MLKLQLRLQFEEVPEGKPDLLRPARGSCCTGWRWFVWADGAGEARLIARGIESGLAEAMEETKKVMNEWRYTNPDASYSERFENAAILPEGDK